MPLLRLRLGFIEAPKQRRWSIGTVPLQKENPPDKKMHIFKPVDLPHNHNGGGTRLSNHPFYPIFILPLTQQMESRRKQGRLINERAAT